MTLPLGLRVAIGRMIKEGVPLTADWLLAWYSACNWFRTPAKRAQPEFRALFGLLFDELYPNGLRVRMPKRILSARYKASSRAFEADLGRFISEVPDIAHLSLPLGVADKIVDQASDALDKYSRFLGRNPWSRDTIEAHVLLPKRLWKLFPCPEMDVVDETGLTGVIRSGHLATC